MQKPFSNKEGDVQLCAKSDSLHLRINRQPWTALL